MSSKHTSPPAASSAAAVPPRPRASTHSVSALRSFVWPFRNNSYMTIISFVWPFRNRNLTISDLRFRSGDLRNAFPTLPHAPPRICDVPIPLSAKLLSQPWWWAT